ncbi:MAG: single-stranded-DNA-specific exonuclease RecJ [Ktedonobacterales bacterium]
MTDIPGTPPLGNASSRDGVAARSPLTHLFGELRPIHVLQELPRETLHSIPGYSPLLIQLLCNRGVVGADAMSAFLAGDWRSHDPTLLHLDRAVGRIQRAIRDHEQIVVYGDFDCDGITSCALLTLALRAAGANVTSYVPRRIDDGRGLNSEAVRQLAQAGAQLLLTTDCGTANVAEVELASALGLDVIITDHHPPHGPLAPAFAIVNPQQDGDNSLEKGLAGVGVAFRVAEMLLAGDPAHAATLPHLLDLVAIGTIADVAPLSRANWALVRAGLRQMSEAPRAGVRALLRAGRLQAGEVVARDVSFALAPRINACGRMGRPELALELMLVTDAAEAESLAREVEQLNTQRQTITDEILTEARQQVSARAAERAHVIVAQGNGWHLGVLGLVAGRLADEYRMPAVVISCDRREARGSARGSAGVDLGTLLAARAEFFTRFGGHAQAAGFTLPMDMLPDFLAYLTTHFSSLPAVGARPDRDEAVPSVTPVLADCRLGLGRLAPGSDVYDDLEALEPFGAGFAEPVFVCPGVRIVSCRRSGVEGRTLRLRLTHGGASHEFIWSRRGELCETLRSKLDNLPPVDVAFVLRRYSRSAGGQPEWLAHIETLAPSGV